ncbi:MAG: BON domain-containing protein [Gammaproteobacteria bacterium]
MRPHHRSATVAFIAAVGGIGCQTEPALQPAPVERGEPQSARTMVADAELLQRVQVELAREPAFAAVAMRVEAANGVVRLRGAVRDRAQQARAREIARSIPGVRRIDDQLIRHGRSGVADGPLPQLQLQL